MCGEHVNLTGSVSTADPQVRQLLEAVTSRLADGVVAIDHRGVVAFVNPAAELLTGRPRGDMVGRPWSELVAANDGLSEAIGRSLRRCETARVPAVRLSRGRDVAVTTTPVTRGDGLAGAVLVLSDLSADDRSDNADERRDALIDRLKEEMAALDRMSDSGRTPVTADSYGPTTVRESSGDVFRQMVDEFCRLLRLALEQQTFRADYPVHDGVREPCERLGRAGGGPRDVIDIYRAALEHCQAGVAPAKARAYIEEGRLLVLELMGDLVTFYRRYAQPPGPAGMEPRP